MQPNKYTCKQPLQRRKYCHNCGKYGHNNKECNDPITSVGIVCVNIDDKYIDLTKGIIESFVFKSSFDIKQCLVISKYNSKNHEHLHKLLYYMDSIKFLMVQRKYSLGYLEFIRGKYEIEDYKHIISLFEQMSRNEIEMISNSCFDTMWLKLWKNTAFVRMYENEYVTSKTKFDTLKQPNNNDILPLKFYTQNIEPKYQQEEWGFPKGRRQFHENNIQCAIREFEEESELKSDNYTVLNKLIPVKEIFKGTNSILYKHIYYLAISHNTYESTHTDNNEVERSAWFTYNQANQLIRDYHVEKKKLLNEVFLFCVNELCKQNGE